MDAIERARDLGAAAWEALCAYNIAPTPRNFEIWYSYLGSDNPKLAAQLDKLIKEAGPLTPGVLDALFQEFFADTANAGTVIAGSRELRQIATQMATRVAADRTLVHDYANALTQYEVSGEGAIDPELKRTIGALEQSTTHLHDRMRLLEQMLAASVERINKLESRLAKSEHDATRDALTGLANRRLFDTAIRDAADLAVRDQSPLCLLMLDIDHFKQFNDTHGHPVGDNVLRLVGKVLQDHLKGRDTAARYGGEEFAVILLSTPIDGAIVVAEQIRGLLSSRPIVNRGTGQKLGIVTCSIGVAQFQPGEAVGDLISRADAALYRAKRGGRNKVCT